MFLLIKNGDEIEGRGRACVPEQSSETGVLERHFLETDRKVIIFAFLFHYFSSEENPLTGLPWKHNWNVERVVQFLLVCHVNSTRKPVD